MYKAYFLLFVSSLSLFPLHPFSMYTRTCTLYKNSKSRHVHLLKILGCWNHTKTKLHLTPTMELLGKSRRKRMTRQCVKAIRAPLLAMEPVIGRGLLFKTVIRRICYKVQQVKTRDKTAQIQETYMDEGVYCTLFKSIHCLGYHVHYISSNGKVFLFHHNYTMGKNRSENRNKHNESKSGTCN